MENQELALGYLNWGVIIITTFGLFALFSKKKKSIGALLALTLIPAWIFAAVVQGLIYLNINNSQILLVPSGFANLLAETLPITIVFGGLTFYFQYRKLKKSLDNRPTADKTPE
jgi:hypothetical protein